MIVKALVSKKNPAVFGILEGQTINYTMLPDNMNPNVTWESIVKYVSPDAAEVLEEYELATFEFKRIS